MSGQGFVSQMHYCPGNNTKKVVKSQNGRGRTVSIQSGMKGYSFFTVVTELQQEICVARADVKN